MAIPFNGVFLTREMGAISPTLLLDKVEISNTVINDLKIDKGTKSVFKGEGDSVVESDITANAGNLLLVPEPKWSLNTEFYGSFNNTLEAGPLFLNSVGVDSVVIRRTSNRTNMSSWEDIKIVEDIQEISDNPDGYLFSDKSIESGVLYKYSLQPMIGSARGHMYQAGESIIIYEDKYLVGEGGRQLKLRFNGSVSSIRRVIQETKTETIGSKYPFVTKNANIDYKEFSLSGTITHFMDSTEEFAPRAELFLDDEFSIGTGDNLETFYEDVYEYNGLNDYNNTVLEREFRDKVERFLNDGKPKLLKSPNEKNALVRITGITLTPNQILGGLIYDFSCTAVEIGEATLENLKKYKIQG